MENQKIMESRLLNYQAFWGRKADLIYSDPDKNLQPQIDVYRFPPIKNAGFFKKIWKPVVGQYVYITGGMADLEMANTGKNPSRVELTTYANEIYMNDQGDQDLISGILSLLAHTPFQENIFFSVGHTISVKDIVKLPNSEMSAFFFSITPSVELGRLCSASINARLMLQVVPITESERKLGEEKGPIALVDYFEKNNIQPIFDLRRKPLI